MDILPEAATIRAIHAPDLAGAKDNLLKFFRAEWADQICIGRNSAIRVFGCVISPSASSLRSGING
jgi:hypothetical protein